MRCDARRKLSSVGDERHAASMLGIVWIGFVGKLISFNLNY
jgi:hypothetical protein